MALNLKEIWEEIPGSAYYPESRISVPIYPNTAIELEMDGKIYYREWRNDGQYKSNLFLFKVDESHAALQFMIFIEDYTQMLDEKINSFYRSEDNGDITKDADAGTLGFIGPTDSGKS